MDAFAFGKSSVPAGFPIKHLWVTGCKKGKPMFINGSLNTESKWAVFLVCNIDPALVFNEVKNQAIRAGFLEIGWKPPSVDKMFNGLNGINGECTYVSKHGWLLGVGYHDYTRADPEFIKKWKIQCEPRTLIVEILPPQ